MSIRTKPLLLEPRFSASAPLRGFLHAAWWVVPRPAAGSTSPSASTRPRAVCICLFGLCGTLQGLVVSRWHFGWPWGSIVAPWASILTHMGYSWEAFRHFGETLGLHFGTLGLHLGTLGVHVGVLWALWGVALDPSGHFCRRGSKNVPKIIGLGSQAGCILMIF